VAIQLTQAELPVAVESFRGRERAFRPRGWPGHLAALVRPSSAAAGRVALERSAAFRWRRLRGAAIDHLREPRNPTRRRMRALRVAPGGRITWQDAPAPPAPRPGEAVVHPIAVAACDLDRQLLLGATPFVLPLHFGHECVAEVLSVGEGVTSVRPGQRVVVPFQISCGACSACREGRTGNCLAVPPISMYGFGVAGGHWGGAMSDELLVPFADAMLVKLPDGIDPAAAASVADNVADAYRHIGPHLPTLLDRDPDIEVLILGAVAGRILTSSSVALYSGLIAQALGAATIRLADRRPHVRAHAHSLGLLPLTPTELRRHPPAPLVVEGSATRPGLRLALEHLAPDGICSCVGSLHRSTSIPTALMFGRNATLHLGRSHARAVIPAVLDLMVQGRLAPELVTTQLAPLDEAPLALHRHAIGEDTKTILVE
jgi:alcohol dehydrogenase